MSVAKKELPTIKLEGTLFEVDVRQNLFRQKDRPQNRISFDEMQYQDTHYTMAYDKSKKTKPWLDSFKKDVVEVKIPELVKLDPEALAKKYKVAVADLKGKSDFEIIVDQHLYKERESGKLPVIDVAGQSYFIDIRLHELRATDNFMNKINLKKPFQDDDGNFHLFYDVVAKKVVESPADSNNKVVHVVLPSETRMDPYAVARDHTIHITDFLLKHPIQKNLKAQVWPAAKSMAKDKKLFGKQRLLQKSNKGSNKKKGPHL